MAGSMTLLALGAHHLWALMVGILVVDLAIQSVHVQNQQLIFGIDPAARSRLNTGYMVSYFIGGAIGSATTGLAYAAGGWSSVILLGVGYSGVALLLWLAGTAITLGRRRTVGERAAA
jgi:predicted MFS family arabinose efflux permease